jgi:Ca2+-binding EF-hand superfamily protein
MLPAICDAWGLSQDACGPLHEAFKEAFDIDSTAFFDDNDFHNYLDSLHGLLVTEFGTMVAHINEPPNVAEISMKKFLDIYKKMK